MTGTGYDLLRQHPAPKSLPPSSLIVQPREAYARYHKIHKVFVGKAGGDELRQIHNELGAEKLPRYLQAAGWAAVEAALVSTDANAKKRSALLRDGVECWERALAHQLAIKEDETHPWLDEDSAPYRMALDIAHAPLLQAIVAGVVTESIKRQVIADTMNIAQAAQVQLSLAKQAGDMEAVSDFSGFGYECNSLILLNMITDSRGVAIPSSPRAGAGYHYPKQTMTSHSYFNIGALYVRCCP